MIAWRRHRWAIYLLLGIASAAFLLPILQRVKGAINPNRRRSIDQ